MQIFRNRQQQRLRIGEALQGSEGLREFDGALHGSDVALAVCADMRIVDAAQNLDGLGAAAEGPEHLRSAGCEQHAVEVGVAVPQGVEFDDVVEDVQGRVGGRRCGRKTRRGWRGAFSVRRSSGPEVAANEAATC